MGPIDNLSSVHFSWQEALWLPTYGRMATEADGLDDTVRTQLNILFTQMDKVRDYFNSPINVHVAYRPTAYNALIGGAVDSAHIYGMACDFDIKGISCDDARDKIIVDNKLEEWSMRMEKRPGSGWIHLDIRELLPNGNRYFLP